LVNFSLIKQIKIIIMIFRNIIHVPWESFAVSYGIDVARILCGRDVNVLIILDFSFRYDSVHQKY